VNINVSLPPPIVVKSVVDSANSVTAEVPSTGGAVEIYSAGIHYKLDIPPNALLGAQQISLTPVLSSAGLPDGTIMKAGIRIQPDGLRLLTAATLTMDLATALDGVTLGSSSSNDGTGFHFEPVETNAAAVTFHLMHFSDELVEDSQCLNLPSLTNVSGLSAEEIARQKLALLTANVTQCQDGVDVTTLEAAVMQIHYDWFFGDGGVNSLTDLAQQNPDLALRSAIDELNAWYASLMWSPLVSEYGLDADQVPFPNPIPCGVNGSSTCTDLGELAEGTARRIASTFEKEMQLADNRCTAAGISDDNEAWQWINLASILGRGDPYVFYENAEYDSVLVPELVQMKSCGISALQITPSNPQVPLGEQIQLDAVYLASDGHQVAKPLLLSLQWDDPSHSGNATVDGNGLVNALKIGQEEIEAFLMLPAGESFYDSQTTITVAGVDSVIVVPANQTISVGGTYTFGAKALDKNGNPLALPVDTWEISDPTVAALCVSGPLGCVEGIKVGPATLKATIAGVSGTASIKVVPAKVVLQPLAQTIPVGGTATFTATALDLNGNSLGLPVDKWETSDPTVAALCVSGPLGCISGIKIGTATITATIAGTQGTATVTVRPQVTSVTITPQQLAMPVGSTYQYAVAGKDASGNIVADTANTWTTSCYPYPTNSTISADGLLSTKSGGDYFCWVSVQIDNVLASASYAVYSGVASNANPLAYVATSSNYIDTCEIHGSATATCHSTSTYGDATAIATMSVTTVARSTALVNISSTNMGVNPNGTSSSELHLQFRIAPIAPVPDPPASIAVTIASQSSVVHSGPWEANAFVSGSNLGFLYLGKYNFTDYPDSVTIQVPLGAERSMTLYADCLAGSMTNVSCSADIGAWLISTDSRFAVVTSPPII
jgi:hypothetical protein